MHCVECFRSCYLNQWFKIFWYISVSTIDLFGPGQHSWGVNNDEISTQKCEHLIIVLAINCHHMAWLTLPSATSSASQPAPLSDPAKKLPLLDFILNFLSIANIHRAVGMYFFAGNRGVYHMIWSTGTIVSSNTLPAPWGLYWEILPQGQYFLIHSLGRISGTHPFTEKFAMLQQRCKSILSLLVWFSNFVWHCNLCVQPNIHTV